MKAQQKIEQVRCVWNAHAQLGEGPLWSVNEQALYWVDILNCRLHRLSHDNEQRTWELDGEISSVCERAESSGVIATLRYGFAFFDPETHSLTHLVKPEINFPAHRFNDGKCDQRGRYWAGSVHFDCNVPVGSLYCLSPDLSVTQVDTGYTVTNGPTWSADQTLMYYNDSALGRVYVFDFDLESGTVSNKRLFLQFSEEDGSPDGMTTDAEGGLWIAHWGASKVTRHDRHGNVMQTIQLPCSQITSCAFGGADLQTLFITSAAAGLSDTQLEREPLAGGLFAVDLNIEGVPANTFQELPSAKVARHF
jgi:D-xylonolactonase